MCPEKREEHSSDGDYTRSQLRSLIFHVLYGMEGRNYEDSVDLIIDNINCGYDQKIKLDGEVAQSAQSIVDMRDKLDDIIKSFLQNWRIERLGMCTKIILRIGTWEILETDTPSSIIINEAIELAKDFGEKDAYKFINGILDQIAEKREELKNSN